MGPAAWPWSPFWVPCDPAVPYPLPWSSPKTDRNRVRPVGSIRQLRMKLSDLPGPQLGWTHGERPSGHRCVTLPEARVERGYFAGPRAGVCQLTLDDHGSVAVAGLLFHTNGPNSQSRRGLWRRHADRRKETCRRWPKLDQFAAKANRDREERRRGKRDHSSLDDALPPDRIARLFNLTRHGRAESAQRAALFFWGKHGRLRGIGCGCRRRAVKGSLELGRDPAFAGGGRALGCLEPAMAAARASDLATGAELPVIHCVASAAALAGKDHGALNPAGLVNRRPSFIAVQPVSEQ